MSSSYTNANGDMIMVLLRPGANAENVAREANRVLNETAADELSARLDSGAAAAALGGEEWRDTQQLAELANAEVSASDRSSPEPSTPERSLAMRIVLSVRSWMLLLLVFLAIGFALLRQHLHNLRAATPHEAGGAIAPLYSNVLIRRGLTFICLLVTWANVAWSLFNLAGRWSASKLQAGADRRSEGTVGTSKKGGLIWAIFAALLCGSPGRTLGVEVADRDNKAAEQRQRRQFVRQTEEDLLRQLSFVQTFPDINRDRAKTLLAAYRSAFEFNKNTYSEPTILLREFPFMSGLPVRSGSASRLDPESAITLGRLSQKLHIYLDTLTAQGFFGLQPDFAGLQEWLRKETRGQAPEWLRPAAVPALVQILMEGDEPLRLLLVAVLAEIQGRPATVALAQRAAFDMSSDVRRAATGALRGRDSLAVRSVLMRAMRYPWAPVAGFAAETLVALEDREAVPQLVALLRQPDPTAPVAIAENRYRVAELVRVNHETGCMYCHPPGSPNDPVFRLDSRTTQLVAPRPATVRAGHYQGGATISLPTLSANNPSPVFMRADVTFLRQDFSQKLPTNSRRNPTKLTRFDFLVRQRNASAAEFRQTQSLRHELADYPQRDAVLFALRELTGQDVGRSTEAWLRIYPRAEFDADVSRLSAELLRLPAERKAQRLRELRDAKGVVHTEALAAAVPQLSGAIQAQARTALSERLARMTAKTLREKFQEDNAEVRRAAASACARKGSRELVPDLIELLQDTESEVAQSSLTALKELTSKDFGPTPNAPPEECVRAVATWKNWWEKQQAANE